MQRPITWKVVTLGAALTGLGVIGAGAAMAEPTDALRESVVTLRANFAEDDMPAPQDSPGFVVTGANFNAGPDRPDLPGPGVLPPPGHLQQLPGVPPPGHWGVGPIKINPGWVNHL